MLVDKPEYKKLEEHFLQISKKTLVDLFRDDASRAINYTVSANDMVIDFSKNNITSDTLSLLFSLAKAQNLDDKIQEMFSGIKINNTEKRAVLHTALRATAHQKISVDGKNVVDDIHHELNRMKEFSQKLHNGKHKGYTNKPITDIVNIGIGGSDLGPVLVCQALKPYRQAGLNIHFISSVDGYQINDTLESLNPETTLFIVASKTFTTQETITNAMTARKWFLEKTNNNLSAIGLHFVAASTNAKAVSEFGIDLNNMFQFWDFVGGRYSLWSAIGLPIILYIGYENFNQLLAGAHDMDEHFATTKDYSKNLPVMLALISLWYINFYDYTTQVISPYNTRLTRFPAYVQQLEMESNGKSVDRHANPINYKTCPVIWGIVELMVNMHTINYYIKVQVYFQWILY